MLRAEVAGVDNYSPGDAVMVRCFLQCKSQPPDEMRDSLAEMEPRRRFIVVSSVVSCLEGDGVQAVRDASFHQRWTLSVCPRLFVWSLRYPKLLLPTYLT